MVFSLLLLEKLLKGYGFLLRRNWETLCSLRMNMRPPNVDDESSGTAITLVRAGETE